MLKVTIISQDYDGCYSIMVEGAIAREIEFQRRNYEKTLLARRCSPEKIASWKDKIDEQFTNYQSNLPRSIELYKSYLTSITKDADQVRVYVGSDRQSCESDKKNTLCHGNGSVFPALINLCHERTTEKQPWVFEPLLLADPLAPNALQPYKRQRGIAFKHMMEHPTLVQYAVKEDSVFFQNTEKMIVHSKRQLILTQMWDAYEENPNAEILDFHFIDDRDDLITDVLKLQPNELPPGMILKVSKFDFYGMSKDKNLQPGLCGTITSDKPNRLISPKSTAPEHMLKLNSNTETKEEVATKTSKENYNEFAFFSSLNIKDKVQNDKSPDPLINSVNPVATMMPNPCAFDSVE